MLPKSVKTFTVKWKSLRQLPNNHVVLEAELSYYMPQPLSFIIYTSTCCSKKKKRHIIYVAFTSIIFYKEKAEKLNANLREN
jgi:hypothetical protein